ncbi:MAG: hypothetical protein ACJAT2_000296 [Bacteriovoracaceae bacterium]|jgi:hypothetical protein
MLKFIFISIFLSFSAFALPTPQDEQVVKAEIDKWYNQIGFAGKIDQDIFETAVRGYFHYKKQGKIPDKNILGIVDFKIPSTEKRFFIFQIGVNAKMLREEWTTHGTGSGPPNGPAETFSNIPESHQSSRGFYKTSETYHGKYGYSLRMDGLENGVNHKVRPRAVVIHGARYIGPGQGGRSWGCIAVAMNRKDPVINLIKGGILIYGSDGQSHNSYSFMGGNGSVSSEDISTVSGTDNDPGEEIDPEFVNIEDTEEFKNMSNPRGNFPHENGGFGALGTPDAIPSQAAIESLSQEEDKNLDNTFSTDATNPNSDQAGIDFNCTGLCVDCQNRSSAPWQIVVAEASKPNGRPEKFFEGTNLKLMEDVKTMDQVPDEVIKNMAISNRNKVAQCVAYARSSKDAYYENKDLNTPTEVSSKDGSITCKYESAEAQDYRGCLELSSAVDQFNESEEENKKNQGIDFAKFGVQVVQDVRGPRDSSTAGSSPQVTAALAQNKLTKASAAIARKRSQFQIEKMKEIDRLQAAMPNRNSILNDCRTYMKGRDAGTNSLKALVNYLEVKDKSVPPVIDPCFSVIKLGKTNLVQNINARKQAIKVIEKAGYKSEDLNQKERTLLNQNALAGRTRIGATKTTSLQNELSIGKFKPGEAEKFGFGKKLKLKKNDCSGGDCKATPYKGRLLDKGGQRLKEAKYAAYSPSSSTLGLYNSYNKKNSSGAIEDSKKARFKKGVFDESFYTNIELAMAGQYAYEDLSPAQKKEYDSLKEYELKDRLARNQKRSKTTASEKEGKRGLGSEIWFDKEMDLFKIISNRYGKIFNSL